jgi:hypothetical protein
VAICVFQLAPRRPHVAAGPFPDYWANRRQSVTQSRARDSGERAASELRPAMIWQQYDGDTGRIVFPIVSALDAIFSVTRVSFARLGLMPAAGQSPLISTQRVARCCSIVAIAVLILSCLSRGYGY